MGGGVEHDLADDRRDLPPVRVEGLARVEVLEDAGHRLGVGERVELTGAALSAAVGQGIGLGDLGACCVGILGLLTRRGERRRRWLAVLVEPFVGRAGPLSERDLLTAGDDGGARGVLVIGFGGFGGGGEDPVGDRGIDRTTVRETHGDLRRIGRPDDHPVRVLLRHADEVDHALGRLEAVELGSHDRDHPGGRDLGHERPRREAARRRVPQRVAGVRLVERRAKQADVDTVHGEAADPVVVLRVAVPGAGVGGEVAAVVDRYRSRRARLRVLVDVRLVALQRAVGGRGIGCNRHPVAVAEALPEFEPDQRACGQGDRHRHPERAAPQPARLARSCRRLDPFHRPRLLVDCKSDVRGTGVGSRTCGIFSSARGLGRLASPEGATRSVDPVPPLRDPVGGIVDGRLGVHRS